MRIGLVTPAWPGTRTPNGIATAVRHLEAGLSALGHEATILTMAEDGPHDHSRVIPVRRRPWRSGEKLRSLIGGADVDQNVTADCIAAAAGDAVRRHGIEVLVIEETQGWAARAAERLSIPVVVVLHGPWFLHKSLQSRGSAAGDARREAREARALVLAAGIAAPSHDVLVATERHLVLPDVPRAVIANPIPILAAASPDPATRDPTAILFVGRFDRHKGGDVMLDAFERLSAEHPQARLTFVGPDRGVTREDGSVLTLEAALAGLAPNVRARIEVTGPLGQGEIAPLRARHGMTAVASRYETFGYNVLEALASGAAIACTNSGGPGEVLTHGETALLVPPGDAEALATALSRLMRDPALAARLGAAAQDHAAAAFSPSRIAEETVAFLTRVVERRHA